MYISYKEWTDKDNHLIYPSINATVVVGNAVTALESFLDEFAFLPKLSVEAQNVLRAKIDFGQFTCSNHQDFSEKYYN